LQIISLQNSNQDKEIKRIGTSEAPTEQGIERGFLVACSESCMNGIKRGREGRASDRNGWDRFLRSARPQTPWFDPFITARSQL
jgi:hypothetical protein